MIWSASWTGARHGGRSRLTHGEVIAALVANRLTGPRGPCDVMGWGRGLPSHDKPGVPASLLNNDRLGQALTPPPGA
jgi:hypothetical protein